MNHRMIVPAVLSAVMLSTPVLAGGPHGPMPRSRHVQEAAAMTPAGKCMSLERQFDAAMRTHELSVKARQAKSMRNEGGDLCASGRHTAGIAKLEQALKDLRLETKS